ncbi:MAG TPA: Crp/Fnr family transcriptional regulator [Candidatus Acidoferrales bacterium]|nr:Crp/Fnr family transcriptional regulator [Candidatus Acidoferrales bacterium]
MARSKSGQKNSFDVEKYLTSAGISRKIVNYRKGQTIFSQGDSSRAVLYIQQGAVKLTVTSFRGKEAVIALLYPGEFVGEGCIAGQPLRVATASAVEPTTVLSIAKQEMIRVIHEEHEFSDRFVAHMLKRNVRVEEDLADQLFNSSEKRLARALLLIARYGKAEQPEKMVAKISQETLAEMVGTTRSRVSFFMNKFRKLGYIKYNGGLHINSSLLRVVLRD